MLRAEGAAPPRVGAADSPVRSEAARRATGAEPLRTRSAARSIDLLGSCLATGMSVLRSWARLSSAPLPSGPSSTRSSPLRRRLVVVGLVVALACAADDLLPVDARSIRRKGSPRRCCGRSRWRRTGSRTRSAMPRTGRTASSTPRRRTGSCARQNALLCAEVAQLRRRRRGERHPAPRAATTPSRRASPRATPRSARACSRAPPRSTRASRSRPAAARASSSRTSWSRTRASSGRSPRSSRGESRVTLITDPSSAVGAVDEKSIAAVGLARGTGSSSLIFDRVGKDKKVSYGDEIVTAGSPAGSKLPSLYPRDLPIGYDLRREPDRHRPLLGHPAAAVRRPELARVGARADPQADDGARRGTRRASADVRRPQGDRAALRRGADPDLDPRRLHAARRHAPNLVLVMLISISLLRGSIFGAFAGFGAGLLIDTANLGDARLHLAAAHARRLLDRALRRDDRARPLPLPVPLGRGDHRALRVRHARLNAVLGQPTPAGAYLSGLPGDRAPQPDPDLARLHAHAPRLPADRACSTASTRCGSLASQGRPRRFLPARPAGRGALPADPAARAARRDSRASSRSPSSPCCSCGSGRCRCSPARNYLKEAKNNRVRTISIDAPRGEILDSKGHVLVSNVAGTSLEVWPADLPKNRQGAAEASSSALSVVAGDVGQADRGEDRAGHRQPARPGRPPPRDPRGPGHLPRRAPGRVPRRRHPAELPAQPTRTSRCSPRCSATSARSPSRSCRPPRRSTTSPRT